MSGRVGLPTNGERVGATYEAGAPVTDKVGEPSRPRGDAEPAFFALVTPVLAQWRALVTYPVAFVIVVAAITFVVPRKYTATATFAPEFSSPDNMSGSLASLAGQFGISLTSGGSLSPDYYAGILRSRELLRATLTSHFPEKASADTTAGPTLLELLDPNGDTPAERLDDALRTLSERSDAGVDKNTGIVTLTVTTRSADLSARVANRMIALLNDFNLHRLQTSSAERRRFAGERLATAEQELRAAESEQLSFLETNRSFQGSPLLQAQADRLSRRVSLRQEIVLTLRREFEQARIAEARNTPVLTVIDPAVPPTRKSSPSLLLNGILALILGSLTGLAVAFVRATRETARREGWRGYAEFVETLGDVRRGLALRGSRRS